MIAFFDYFSLPCQKQGGLYSSGDYIEIIEYSNEGYFWLSDAKSHQVFTFFPDENNAVRLASKLTDPSQMFNQLWYWNHMYIFSVGDSSMALTLQLRVKNDYPI